MSRDNNNKTFRMPSKQLPNKRKPNIRGGENTRLDDFNEKKAALIQKAKPIIFGDVSFRSGMISLMPLIMQTIAKSGTQTKAQAQVQSSAKTIARNRFVNRLSKIQQRFNEFNEPNAKLKDVITSVSAIQQELDALLTDPVLNAT
jgi:hypothetical protein